MANRSKALLVVVSLVVTAVAVSCGDEAGIATPTDPRSAVSPQLARPHLSIAAQSLVADVKWIGKEHNEAFSLC